MLAIFVPSYSSSSSSSSSSSLRVSPTPEIEFEFEFDYDALKNPILILSSFPSVQILFVRFDTRNGRIILKDGRCLRSLFPSYSFSSSSSSSSSSSLRSGGVDFLQAFFVGPNRFKRQTRNSSTRTTTRTRTNKKGSNYPPGFNSISLSLRSSISATIGKDGPVSGSLSFALTESCSLEIPLGKIIGLTSTVSPRISPWETWP